MLLVDNDHLRAAPKESISVSDTDKRISANWRVESTNQPEQPTQKQPAFFDQECVYPCIYNPLRVIATVSRESNT
jgi:hypothetical protein